MKPQNGPKKPTQTNHTKPKGKSLLEDLKSIDDADMIITSVDHSSKYAPEKLWGGKPASSSTSNPAPVKTFNPFADFKINEETISLDQGGLPLQPTADPTSKSHFLSVGPTVDSSTFARSPRITTPNFDFDKYLISKQGLSKSISLSKPEVKSAPAGLPLVSPSPAPSKTSLPPQKDLSAPPSLSHLPEPPLPEPPTSIQISHTIAVQKAPEPSPAPPKPSPPQTTTTTKPPLPNPTFPPATSLTPPDPSKLPPAIFEPKPFLPDPSPQLPIEIIEPFHASGTKVIPGRTSGTKSSILEPKEKKPAAKVVEFEGMKQEEVVVVKKPLKKLPETSTRKKQVSEKRRHPDYVESLSHILRVKFRVLCPTFFGEEVFVVGSCTELGDWIVEKGLPFKYISDNWWESKTLSFPGEFEYKYIKKDSAGVITWESIKNRLTPSKGDFLIEETFGEPDRKLVKPEKSIEPEQIVIPTTTKELPKQAIEKPKSEYCSIEFAVKCTTSFGQSVFVSGSNNRLGNWEPSYAVPLSFTQNFVWKSNPLKFKVSDRFEYKYFINDSSNNTVWEPIPNRHSPPPNTKIVEEVFGVVEERTFKSPEVKENGIVLMLTCNTKWGDEVFVVGSDEKLGKWDIGEAKKLTFVSDGIWKSKLFKIDGNIEYKFIIKNTQRKSTVWESITNRVYTRKSPGIAVLNEKWDTLDRIERSIPLQQYLAENSKQKQKLLPVASVGKVDTVKAKSGELIFRLCYNIGDVKEVFVVGSVPALGSWDPSKALPLKPMNKYWWQTQPLSISHQFEYKYITKNADNLIWEHVPNRKIEDPTRLPGNIIADFFDSPQDSCIGTPSSDKSPLKVMSFNVRVDVKSDPHQWNDRKHVITLIINDLQPDIIGLQEPEPHQLKDLLSLNPDYKAIGVGRNGGDSGEYSAILYKSSKFAVSTGGTFWLSDTPHVVSMGWDAACLRVCTWAIFTDKKNNPGQNAFAVYNTHLDHVSAIARQAGMDLILNHMATHNDLPTVLTGDFNSEPSDPLIVNLNAQLHNASKGFESKLGTFVSWNPLTPGILIDYIYTNHSCKVKNFEIISSYDKAAVQPSDHRPILAVLKYTL